MRMITFDNLYRDEDDCVSIILDNIKYLHPCKTDTEFNSDISEHYCNDFYGIQLDKYHVNIFDSEDIEMIFGVEYDEVEIIAYSLLYKLYNRIMGNKTCSVDYIDIEGSQTYNFYNMKVDVTKFLMEEAEIYKGIDEEDDDEDITENDIEDEKSGIEKYIDRVKSNITPR